MKMKQIVKKAIVEINIYWELIKVFLEFTIISDRNTPKKHLTNPKLRNSETNQPKEQMTYHRIQIGEAID